MGVELAMHSPGLVATKGFIRDGVFQPFEAGVHPSSGLGADHLAKSWMPAEDPQIGGVLPVGAAGPHRLWRTSHRFWRVGIRGSKQPSNHHA
jgi:hypothetical protein